MNKKGSFKVALLEAEAARQRAPKGSVETHVLLRIPKDLHESIKRKADYEGISISEWWRRAGRNALACHARSACMHPDCAICGPFLQPKT
jgi:predicted HicB family RNase H-like nuclease